MLINELRETIKKYDNNELQKIVAEMYKAIPKGTRETKGIDLLIQDVNSYLKSDTIDKSKVAGNDINKLKPQIELFIEYAYERYYLIPNRLVAKKDRPKWRFIVKNYIKDLQSIPNKCEEGAIATELLEQLFNMLCHGCYYYIFNTDNPFQSVGIRQTELLDIVIKRKIENGIDATNIKSMVALVIDSQIDWNTVTTSLMDVFISNLKTVDAKEMAIVQCKVFRKELEGSKMMKATNSTDKYWHVEKIYNIAELVLLLNFELCQYDDGIHYFKDNYDKTDKEVLLYVLLKLIGRYNLVNYWLKEYRQALKEKIIPRKSLQEDYSYIVESGKMPE